jgi:antagonist of KipI
VTVRIARAGLLTTVQDLGRLGHQHEGVPEGGAMDTHAMRLANLLVGNDDGAAVLEATLSGPTLVFERDTMFAIGGAEFGARLDDEPVPLWRSRHAKAGATLELGAARTGCRAYIALAGGIDVPTVLGSRSTYLPAAFGGFHGRALRAGDVLPLGASREQSAGAASGSRAVARASIPRYERALRVIPGEHLARLTGGARETMFASDLTVSPQSDRMGYRLQGVVLEASGLPEVLSAAVTMGTIQLPRDGAPIVLMADRQTTGGYPRLGQIATVDLGAAAQLRPGATVRFEEISLHDAQRLYLERERDVDALRRALAYRP